jgi:hypothetical protein
MKTRRIVFAFLSMLAAAFLAPMHAQAAAPAQSVGMIAFGAGFPMNNNGIMFPAGTFTQIPIVVVSALKNGKAVGAAAVSVSRSSFVVKLYDPTSGVLVSDGSGVDMRCVAIVPGPSTGIKAGSGLYSDNDTVTFDSPFPVPPVVVCSGYSETALSPLLVSAVAIEKGSF